MTAPAPRKRAAYEPAAGLLARTRYNPGMRRPATTTTGAALVLLRALVGAFALVMAWTGKDAALQRAGVIPTTVLPDVGDSARAAAAIAIAAIVLIQIVLSVLIFFGHNLARVIVMIIATIDIGAAFASWLARGGSLGLAGTIYALALDVLILLALSSQSAAAYARRNERAT